MRTCVAITLIMTADCVGLGDGAELLGFDDDGLEVENGAELVGDPDEGCDELGAHEEGRDDGRELLGRLLGATDEGDVLLGVLLDGALLVGSLLVGEELVGKLVDGICDEGCDEEG